MRFLLLACLVAAVSAFSPGIKAIAARSPSSDVSMAASKGKVNPALFSTGLTPKQTAAAKARKEAEKKKNAQLDQAGLPQFNLFRIFTRPDAKDVRNDGSFKFAKPWENQKNGPPRP